MDSDAATLERPKLVEATLTFAAPSAQKTRTYTFTPPPGEPWSTVELEDHVVAIAAG